MGVPNGNLDDLERQRLELEGNIQKLQQSLYHWRTWEAEYDGLKDEINDLYDDATTEDFLRVGRNLDGSLVTEDEVKVILGQKVGVSRSREQVVNLISRRIDYVKQNVETMEKRLRAAEDQLLALDSIEQHSTAEDFPMTEIMEELDEDGNVISTSTSTPGSQAPSLLEILKKAGVKDIPELPGQETKAGAATETEEKKQESEDEKIEDITREPETTELSIEELQTRATNAPVEPEDEERPVTDVDESPEDAELRRQMLEYGLNEVGSVVAELELDDGSDVSYDGFDDYDSDEDEDEDEYGRTKGRVLDEDYHQQMRELEAKLNARGMYNMGKDTGSLPAEVLNELEQPVAEVETAEGPSKKPKKKVAFAEELNIAPAPKPPVAEKKTPAPREPSAQVLSDAIVERTEPVEKGPSTAQPPKKTSRFKSARKADNAETAPVPPPTISRPPELRSSLRKLTASSSTPLPLFPAKPTEPKPFSQPISDISEKPSPSASRPPEDKILADKLHEREVSEGNAVAPEPDELDDQLHRKEIATEFYKMRNNMIQQNGGFLDDDEPEIVPIETEEAPKRVSKFKAARMK